MPKITVVGVGRSVDGEYILDLSEQFTGHELHLIKQISGVRVAEIAEAMGAGDYDLVIALTKVAIDRSGKTADVDLLMRAKVGAITFDQTDEEKAADEEDDELPPASAPSGANETESTASTSGVSSRSDSEHPQENGQPPTTGLTLATG